MALMQKFVFRTRRGLPHVRRRRIVSSRAKFGRTPIGDMLPVYLDHPADDKPAWRTASQSYPGRLAAAMGAAAQQRIRRKSAPAGTCRIRRFSTKCRGIKPGASVIGHGERTDARTCTPRWRCKRFGNGRVGALDDWRPLALGFEGRRQSTVTWTKPGANSCAGWFGDVPNRNGIAGRPKARRPQSGRSPPGPRA